MKKLIFLLALLMAVPAWAGEEIGQKGNTTYAIGNLAMPLLCGRQDSISALTGADGRYGLVKCDNLEQMYVKADTELPAAVLAADNLALPTAPFVNALIFCYDAAGANADMCRAANTYLEDVASVGGEQLYLFGGIRQDSLSASQSADGDYANAKFSGLGQLYVQPTPGVGNGAFVCYLTSAASTNATNCKNAAGNLYGVEVVNTTSTIYYLRLYNLAAAPTCSSATGFWRTVPIPHASGAGAGIANFYAVGEALGTGIGFCLTGGGSSTDNTNAATGVYIALHYR